MEDTIDEQNIFQQLFWKKELILFLAQRIEIILETSNLLGKDKIVNV